MHRDMPRTIVAPLPNGGEVSWLEDDGPRVVEALPGGGRRLVAALPGGGEVTWTEGGDDDAPPAEAA